MNYSTDPSGLTCAASVGLPRNIYTETAKWTSVTVIVPTYNCGHFIAEAIDSILGQTRVPEQIIVVDDGSTDDTEQVVCRYTDARIEYIKQQNAGVSVARNTGLAAARGELVTFLDADDRWLPTYVEKMRAIMVARPSAVCAFANFVRFDHATGERLKDQFQYYHELREPDLGDEVPSIALRGIAKPWAFQAFVRFGEIPAFTVVMMFRRVLIADLRFDPALRVCQDLHFVLRAFMHGDVTWTREILCEVRRHGGNATRERHAMSLHKLNALKAVAPFVTGDADFIAYRDRLVKAHIDAAVNQIRSREVRAGIRAFWDGVRVPGSRMRKIRGSLRMALVFVGG